MLTRRELLKFAERRKPAPDDYWLHLSRTAMACRFEATLPIADRAGTSVTRLALAEADRLEQQLTIFRETSEVSQINRTAAAQPVRVEASLFDLLLQCQALSRETAGAFDITSGPLSDCWGFLRRQGRIPEPQEIAAARALVGFNQLILDTASRTVRFARDGVRINFGSIGKGYALDRISVVLDQRVRVCLLSAGASSIRAIGSGDRTGWLVGVRHPRDKTRRLARLRMRDCAMATSGHDEQFFEYQGKRYGHIIDPRTGHPAERVSGVTVITQSAAMADALATAFFVGGPEMAADYCSTHPGVLVIMLERAAERAIVFGSNTQCKVEIISE
jgi:thiamine biosynthesis lipoprotein